MRRIFDRVPRRWVTAAAATAAATVSGLLLLIYDRSREMRAGAVPSPGATARPEPKAGPDPAAPDVLTLDEGQREAISLKVEATTAGTDSMMVRAHGQVTPDETNYAYITPRASGVVRYVTAHEGQRVKAGDLLAMIDSPDLARARFELYTQKQELEIARSEADWQGVVYKNTVALLESLERGDSPEEIDRAFEDRPVGTNRERLISTYSARRLAKVTYDRNQELFNQKVIPGRQFQQVRAEYESAEAAYQSLTEQMRYSARLANTQARQKLRKAETSVRVARATLRMLGVSPDGSVSEIQGGRVVGVDAEGNLSLVDHPEPRETEEDLAADIKVPGDDDSPVRPIGGNAEGDPITGTAGHPSQAEPPVSSYPIWAPFDGTVIDRMMIVPGVFVDTAHRIFTLANLSTVWVEAYVHESNYAAIARGRDARVRFTSPSYPDEVFEATVLYSGDMVDPKTRTLRLIARAQNPDHRLKPGMFVDVEIVIPEGRPVTLAPEASVLTDGSRHVAFVETAPGRFERREVRPGASIGGKVEVLSGLSPGEAVVTEGAFKLKAALALQQEVAAGPEVASE